MGRGTWTAILVLLAVRPAETAPWAIAFVRKPALVIAGLAFPDAPGAGDLVLWDGLLRIVLASGLALSAVETAAARTPRCR